MRKLANALLRCMLLMIFPVIAPALAQASDLAAIKDQQVVRVGAVEAAPWYTKDLLTNEWQGLVPDVMQAIFADTGIKVEYVETQWGTAVAGLQSNRFDLLGAFNATPERRQAIDFTEPMGELKFAILSLNAPPPEYASWEMIDTPKFHLAAVDGTGASTTLQPLLPNLQWTMMPTSDAMFMQLESGRVDAVVTSDVQISQYIQQRRRGHMTIPTPTHSQPTNIGLRQSADPQLRDWLDERLSELRENGSLEGIWSKYIAAAE